MGAHGPVPKRSDARRRRNLEGGSVDKVTTAGAVRIPALPKGTHRIARQWYLALKASGQAQYFEPSDWAVAQLVCEQITRLMAASSLAVSARDYQHIAIPGSQFAGIWTAMNDLLSTEASRRRVRLEVERETGAAEEEPAGITAIEEFRRRMEG
jgi:hypothetical protein